MTRSLCVKHVNSNTTDALARKSCSTTWTKQRNASPCRPLTCCLISIANDSKICTPEAMHFNGVMQARQVSEICVPGRPGNQSTAPTSNCYQKHARHTVACTAERRPTWQHLLCTSSTQIMGEPGQPKQCAQSNSPSKHAEHSASCTDKAMQSSYVSLLHEVPILHLQTCVSSWSWPGILLRKS